MSHTSYKFISIKHLFEELKFVVKVPIAMHCDNQATIPIAPNTVFHERNKHIEVNCHITLQNEEDGVIALPYVSTRVQIGKMFPKTLCKIHLDLLCNKLGLYDIYSPT